MTDNRSDGRQSLSDLGAALQTQRDAVVASSDEHADAYMAGQLNEPTQTAPLRAQELDKFGRAYATGRRKDAVARVVDARVSASHHRADRDAARAAVHSRHEHDLEVGDC